MVEPGTESYGHPLFVNGPEVLFRWDFASSDAESGYKVLRVSPSVERVLGYTPYDFQSGRVVYYKIIHPEDLNRVMKQVDYYYITRILNNQATGSNIV